MPALVPVRDGPSLICLGIVELNETSWVQMLGITMAFEDQGLDAMPAGGLLRLPDLVLAPGYISNLEANWEEPNFARFLERLASRFRVVVFDKRGTGLSDRIPAATLEERADDDYWPETFHRALNCCTASVG